MTRQLTARKGHEQPLKVSEGWSPALSILPFQQELLTFQLKSNMSLFGLMKIV